MKRLHIVPGLEVGWNGIAVAAKMIAREQGAAIVDADCNYEGELDGVDEVWVHSVWTLKVWRACWKAMRRRKRLVRMLHGNVDPVRLGYHGWKKWLVGPIERYFLRRADRIVATCEAEKGWIEEYLGKRCPPIEVTDIKRFFDLSRVAAVAKAMAAEERVEGKLHLLYLGRRHPLKGLEFLEKAVKKFDGCELRVESNVFGEEKEKVWEWCDVLVLPTLSENFGLVVAEALERGKRVITTDGAPAWDEGLDGQNPSIKTGYGGRLLYLVGYRDGTNERRVELLKSAIEAMAQTVNRQKA